jgi:hypothetical protein
MMAGPPLGIQLNSMIEDMFSMFSSGAAIGVAEVEDGIGV